MGITYFIGIDNGTKSGAIVVIDYQGQIVEQHKMPHHASCIGKGSQVDIRAVMDILDQYDPMHTLVGFEHPVGSKSAQALKSMHGCFHTLRTIIFFTLLDCHYFPPQRWQKAMFPTVDKSVKKDTKTASIELAKSIWPSHDFRANKRCRVPDHNITDAALIAEYLRRTYDKDTSPKN